MIDDGELRQAYDELVRARGSRERAACPPPEALLALVEREGPEEQRMRTLDHVMSCAGCRRDFDLVRIATESATRAVAELGGVRSIGTRRHLPWRPLAVAAGLVVAVGIGVLSRDPRTSTPPLLRGSGHTVVLLAPEPRPDGSLLLQWRRLPDAARYRVELFTPSGRMVAGATLADSTYVVAPGAVALGDSLRWMVTAIRGDGSEARSRTERLTR
jgi:hypothetical protein